MLKIGLTGGSSRFAKVLKKKFCGKHIIYTTKKDVDILKYITIVKFIKLNKIKILVHLAGLSRPMAAH